MVFEVTVSVYDLRQQHPYIVSMEPDRCVVNREIPVAHFDLGISSVRLDSRCRTSPESAAIHARPLSLAGYTAPLLSRNERVWTCLSLRFTKRITCADCPFHSTFPSQVIS